MTTTLTDKAREALRLAEADPGQSAKLAAAVAAQAKAAHDVAAAAVAERALGLAALHLDNAATAMRHLRAAVTLGRRAQSPSLAAEARMTLAYVLNGRGRSRQALREINAAMLDLDGVERARAEAQRGTILVFLGRADEALASFRHALPALRRAGDHVWVQRVLSNRAVVYGYQNEFTAAVKDLREAEGLCDQHDLGLSAGFVQQNLGWIETLRGDVPAALSHLDLAEQRFRALGSRLGFILADRSELLLSVRLVSEARQTGEQAVRQIEREGQQIALPEARLILARAAALDRDSAYAVSQARRAVSEFARQQRPHWTALARFVLLSSRLSENGPPQVTVRQFEQAADALTATGWAVAALEARLLAGKLALGRGRKSEGCRLLVQVSQGRRRGPALLRSRAWYAEALIRLANGNARGAVGAARSGLRVLDEYRATLAATDLRAYAAGHRSELAALGLRIAITSGNAGRVLMWAEEGRARHLLSRPARPPEDPELAAALSRLRVTVAKIGELRHAGRHSADLVGRQAALERQIRDHYRRQPHSGVADPAPAVSVADLAAALGEAALVEFIQHDGELLAVTVTDGRARLQHVGALDPLGNLIDHSASALRRLARYHVSEASRAAAVTMLRYAGGQLDTTLLDPLAGQIDGRPLVVIPTGPLQSLPWSLLPSCMGRPVTVAPSAALWYAAHCRKPPQRRQVTIAAGPGLPGARDEAEAVAAIYRTTALHGSSATVHAVTAALHGADLVHLAAHGRVRADNPLFSSLRLADGPLTVFDLERLDRVAPMVVLAACDSGRPVVCTGDELLGFSATLLSLGTHQLIASVVPIPDVETAPLMIAFHRHLAAGHKAADALSQAQRQLADGESRAMAAAAGFICIGDGMKAQVRSDQEPSSAGTGEDDGARDELEQSGLYRFHRCTLLCQTAVRAGSVMGYSGTAAPTPELTCLPGDWWDPAWQSMKSAGASEPAPALWDPAEAPVPAAGTTQPQTHPPKPPPSWAQVLAATLGLWTSRHLPWLRRFSRRRLAAVALGAGLVAVAVGTTGLAAAAFSPEQAVHLPAGPSPIPAPSGRAVLSASVATAQQAARPVWLSVPAIGVRTSLVDLGLRENGTLQVPSSTAVAGWYTGSPRPGSVGATVIAGHVDSRSGPGIFFWLRTLHPGDRVYVGRADGTMAVFTVTAVRKFAKDQFPTASVYGPVPDAELRLITCGGVFDRSLGSYLSNVVVFARLSG